MDNSIIIGEEFVDSFLFRSKFWDHEMCTTPVWCHTDINMDMSGHTKLEPLIPILSPIYSSTIYEYFEDQDSLGINFYVQKSYCLH
jgi:hypothetical protein